MGGIWAFLFSNGPHSHLPKGFCSGKVLNRSINIKINSNKIRWSSSSLNHPQTLSFHLLTTKSLSPASLFLPLLFFFSMVLMKPLHSNYTGLVNQILVAMIQNRPFDSHLASSTSNNFQFFSSELVSQVLRSVPRFFFQSCRSVGGQKGSRHRTPLKPRKLKKELDKFRNNVLVLGPAAHRDLDKVEIGLDKALEFYYWVETCFGFQHDEMTCREMACVLARANRLKTLWDFLKEMSRRGNGGLVTTPTITCLIKVLGEEGLVDEALLAFYRMKQFHCKPDVYAYNTTIFALCRVGFFNKARFLFEQMELPGFRCPPDSITYTILISSYCKYSLQTGCRKATRRRMWEANHLFRLMIFKGFTPDTVTYNSLIDGCCKTYRIERALELFEDMKKRGCIPNRITYNSFIRYYSAVNEVDRAIDMLRQMQTMNHGVPTSSSYTPIIHALCVTERVREAWNFLVELVDGGSVPREYTYQLVCNMLSSAKEGSLSEDGLHQRIKNGIDNRFKQLAKVKPILSRKGFCSNKETPCLVEAGFS